MKITSFQFRYLFSLTVTLLFLVVSVESHGYEQILQEQVNRGEWQNVEETLRHAAKRCSEQRNTNTCLTKVDFSRAWSYSRRAQREPDDRQHYLKSARDGYLAILDRHPQHLATIDNLLLVLEQLNDRQQIEYLLRDLNRLEDKGRLIKATLIVADQYRDESNVERAFGYYWRAFATEPDQRSLKGLLSSFRQSPEEKKAKHMITLAEKTPNILRSRQLYAVLLNHRNTIQQDQWERAAIGWLALLGKERLLSTDTIKQEIDVRLNPEFMELLRRLQDPYLGLSPDDLNIGDMTLIDFRREGWWHQNLQRTWAFTVAAWSQGHNRLVRNDVKGASSTWKAALQFAPPSSSYDDELTGRWAVSLELLTDLARIQRLYKSEIDPDGRTFSEIERTLFFSKAQSYRVNDLQAIQRHHTVMGKMYADLGLFSERQNGVRSAEFQLSNAIKTAEKRSVMSKKKDPQPQLARLLADGYSCRLPGQDSRCRTENNKAQQLYLQATEDYLKLDAVQPAAQTLRRIPTTPQTEIKKEQLRSLIDLRGSFTDDYLQKGRTHPDIVSKKKEIANKWEVLGEPTKAREITDQLRQVSDEKRDAVKLPQQRERTEQIRKSNGTTTGKTRTIDQNVIDNSERVNPTPSQNQQFQKVQPVQLERKKE